MQLLVTNIRVIVWYFMIALAKDLPICLNLKAGSYVESTGRFVHQIENKSDKEATIYIRTNRK
jgi:hypothetical protein